MASKSHPTTSAAMAKTLFTNKPQSLSQVSWIQGSQGNEAANILCTRQGICPSATLQLYSLSLQWFIWAPNCFSLFPFYALSESISTSPVFTCFLLLTSLEMTSRCPPSEVLCLYSLHLGLGLLLFVPFYKHLHNNLWHHDGWMGQLLLLAPLRVAPKSSIVWCPVRGSGHQHHSNPI